MVRDDGRWERLQDQIGAFYEELREEHRQHWWDRQDLEQERRKILREVAEFDEKTLSDLFNRIQ